MQSSGCTVRNMLLLSYSKWVYIWNKLSQFQYVAFEIIVFFQMYSGLQITGFSLYFTFYAVLWIGRSRNRTRPWKAHFNFTPFKICQQTQGMYAVYVVLYVVCFLGYLTFGCWLLIYIISLMSPSFLFITSPFDCISLFSLYNQPTVDTMMSFRVIFSNNSLKVENAFQDIITVRFLCHKSQD